MVDIEKWIIHPLYGKELVVYDLALIELKTELILSDQIHAIQMSNKDFVITDDILVKMAAFGKTCDNCDNQHLFQVIQTTLTPIHAHPFEETEKDHTLSDTHS